MFCDAGCTLNIANFTSTAQPLDVTATSLWLTLDVASHATSLAYVFGNLVLISNVIYMCTTAGTSAGSSPTFTPARGAVTADGATLKWTSMGSCAAGTLAANQSFPLGYVIGVTGQNAGIRKAIKAQVLSSGLVQIQLMGPLPLPVAAGDTFFLVAACDKTLATCQNIYNNRIHYGGMKSVPNPELAQ